MKLRLISAGAAHDLVASVAPEIGVEIEGSFGAVGAMLEKFDGGEPCDVVILTRKQIDALAGTGQVRAQSVADLGAVPTSIAVLAGAAKPDVSSAPALRAALLAADALYFPDPAKATAGIHFAKVVDALGITARVAPLFRNYANGAASMRAMAEAGGQPIGCTQATEIRATPGVTLVASLPPGLDLTTVYAAAVSARAQHPIEASAFVSALAGRLD